MSYSVYVIELEPDDRDEGLTAVYVGQTAHSPEYRFQQHKNGDRASRVVKRRGVRLLPSLFPKPPGSYETRTEAEEEEVAWAEVLRSRGYAVYGGT